MKTILLLKSPHGDELLGDRLSEYMRSKRPELLKYCKSITANPRAYKAKKRYVETDLNRSYTGKCASYEERRASAILKLIRSNKYELVLDLHTTTCNMPACIIVKSLTQDTSDFLRASHIQHIVLMQATVVERSLIGSCPQAVSIEVNKNDISDHFLSMLCDDIERYLHKKSDLGEKHMYQVFGLLYKKEIAPTDDLTNFERSNDGTYPVLFGEKAYKESTDYLGFKANKLTQTRL